MPLFAPICFHCRHEQYLLLDAAPCYAVYVFSFINELARFSLVTPLLRATILILIATYEYIEYQHTIVVTMTATSLLLLPPLRLQDAAIDVYAGACAVCASRVGITNHNQASSASFENKGNDIIGITERMNNSKREENVSNDRW